MTTITLFIMASTIGVLAVALCNVASAIREIAMELRKARKGDKS